MLIGKEIIMKWLVEITKTLTRKPELIFAFSGSVCVLLSFVKLGSGGSVVLTETPGLAMFISGWVLLSIYLVTSWLSWKKTKIDRKANIAKGMTITFSQTSVRLQVGEIQKIPGLDKASAVVLPANTSFIDDCITDRNSALGAFFLEHYPEKIEKIRECIHGLLETSGYKKDDHGLYPPGTTILLPAEYETPAKTIITASTTRKEGIGIRAEPSSVCECIRRIFEMTADKKIDNLYMPILGSGHGGLSRYDALLFLVAAIKHYSKYFHHLKTIHVVVTPKDASKLREIYKLQYLTHLDEEAQ
jgi:O-acetyl-ADP-ribose deacetylase (regulator of RNase III)